MKLIKQITLTIISALLVIIFIACEDKKDNLPELPESAVLSGTITFTGIWPTTGTIYLSLQNNWPATGSPYTSELISSNNLDNMTYNISTLKLIDEICKR